MKKAILALALLAAAGVASAQSNVQIYGTLDAGVTKQTGSSAKVQSGLQNDSLIGIKGTEDLGNGLKAVFVLESNVNVDDGTTDRVGPHGENQLFGRQAYVGLSSTTLGTVKIGRQFSVIYTTLNELDPFVTGTAGDVTRLLSYDRSTSNTVSYSIPEVVTGLTSTLSYSAGENVAPKQYGMTSSYALGRATATVAYNKVDGLLRTTIVGGTYDLTAAKLYAMASESKGLITDSKVYLVGVAAKLGTGTVKGDVVRKTEQKFVGYNVTQVGVGYDYPLSKRTELYASYAHQFNSDSLNKGLSDNLVSTGLRLSF